jgi:hypothetical protein
MDESAILALAEGRAFLDSYGNFIYPDEYFFGYMSETDFSGEEYNDQD